MKKLFVILLLISLWGCAAETICFDKPEAPYGKPDKEVHINLVGMETWKYIYYCYEDSYIEEHWTRYQGVCWEQSFYISQECGAN